MRNLFLIKININRAGIFPLIEIATIISLDKRVQFNFFFYFSTKIYIAGTLNEMVHMSTQNMLKLLGK